MDAYFESLLKNNNIEKSQLVLVEDQAALPASELLRQLHDSEDESPSNDKVPISRLSSASIDIHAFSSRHHSGSFEDEDDNGVTEVLNSSALLLNLSENSIASNKSPQP